MKNIKPLILISNDDGYSSNGLRMLVSFLSDFAEVVVCAPEGPRSGYSTAFSATSYLLLKERELIPDCKLWSCSGTPVDCVKMAFSQLLEGRRPDLVIGGINHGDNSSVNNHYSGTMGVAREGALKGIPSIAFSSCDYDENADLSHLKNYIRNITMRVLSEGLPKNICLNVNFPKGNTIKGVKVCRMGFGSWGNEIVRCNHPRGFDYYWVVGKFQNEEPSATDTDQWALENGYATITPTLIDITDYGMVEKMKDWEGTI